MQLRLLDKDLGAVMKAAEDFDYQRIAFVLEAIVGKQDKQHKQHKQRNKQRNKQLQKQRIKEEKNKETKK